MTTFAARQAAMLERQRDRFGENATFNRYTYGTDNFKTGVKGTATLADGPETVKIVRAATRESLEPAGAGGRVGVERLEWWLIAADLSWEPTKADTRVTFGGKTYRPAAIELENDGLAYRFRLEELTSES